MLMMMRYDDDDLELDDNSTARRLLRVRSQMYQASDLSVLMKPCLAKRQPSTSPHPSEHHPHRVLSLSVAAISGVHAAVPIQLPICTA